MQHISNLPYKLTYINHQITKGKRRKVMKKNTKNIINAVFILCILFAFIYIIMKYQRYFTHISIKHLKNYILSFGPLAAFIFLIIFAIKPVIIVFPALVLTVIAGNIFGPIKGFILTMAGLFLSGSFAFYIAKSLGRPFVNKITRGKLVNIDKNIEVHGFKILLFMRVSTMFPYDPLSYAAGMTKISYKDFISASLLGSFPEMLTYSYLGKNIEHPLNKGFIICLVLVAAIAAGGSIIYKIYAKQNT